MVHADSVEDFNECLSSSFIGAILFAEFKRMCIELLGEIRVGPYGFDSACQAIDIPG